MTIKRLDLETSDLFFNLEKPHYGGLHIDVDADVSEQIETAIRQDAEYVIGAYPRTFDGYTVDDLTADFMRRL